MSSFKGENIKYSVIKERAIQSQVKLESNLHLDMGQFINMILSGSLSTFISHETRRVFFAYFYELACSRSFLKQKGKILGTLPNPQDFFLHPEESYFVGPDQDGSWPKGGQEVLSSEN